MVGVAVAARRPVGGRKNLADVFGGTEHEAVQAGTRWAVDVLESEGISASEQPLVALRELRRANRACRLPVPRFFWTNFCHLASAVAGRCPPKRPRSGPGSPLLNDVDGARPDRRIVDREGTSNQDGISGWL